MIVYVTCYVNVTLMNGGIGIECDASEILTYHDHGSVTDEISTYNDDSIESGSATETDLMFGIESDF